MMAQGQYSGSVEHFLRPIVGILDTSLHNHHTFPELSLNHTFSVIIRVKSAQTSPTETEIGREINRASTNKAGRVGDQYSHQLIKKLWKSFGLEFRDAASRGQ